jgi:hypothetical protein
MKNILIVSILLTLLSCENKKDECKYVTSIVPIDTTLYISYSINNINYRYFQFYQEDAPISYLNTATKSNGQTIFRVNYPFFYGDLNSDKFPVVLTFHDTVLLANGSQLHQRALRKRLHANFRFSIPKMGPEYGYVELALADTVFLRGVALSVNNYEYSTDSVISHYKFNIDSLSEYLWHDSYFRIKRTENACGWDKLIEGEFATIVMKVEDKKLIKVENGRFRILIDK